MDGSCEFIFGQKSEETKLKNVFKVKKCFAPFRADVKRIVGAFVSNNLEVPMLGHSKFGPILLVNGPKAYLLVLV